MDRRSYYGFLTVQLFFPFCVLLGCLTGKEFVLAGEGGYLVSVSILSLWLAGRIRKQEETSRLGIPSLLFSLIHGLTILFVIHWWASGIAAVLVMVCGWMVFEDTPKGWQKIVCQIISLLLSFLLLLVTPVWLFASAMVQNDVVQQLDSPGGRYTALIIRSDQGALGGDTLVEVRDNQETVNILIGSFVDSRRVYHGEWYEWENMELGWESETVLLLNGTACSVEEEDIAWLLETAADLGITIRNGVVLEESDTHGGFHGDGLEMVKIQGNITSMEGEFWHALPLTTQAEAIPAYLAIGEPLPESGRWFFRDRHLQSADRADPELLLSRPSCNFTFAIWDWETGILTCYKIDT